MNGNPVDRKARLEEIRARHQRNIEHLAEIEAALAQFPQELRDQVALAARREERYGLKEFVNYMRSWMSGRNLLQYAALATWLYGTYVMYYEGLHQETPLHTGPRAGGPMRFYASCEGESVVDAVFAKEERASGRRAASRGVA